MGHPAISPIPFTRRRCAHADPAGDVADNEKRQLGLP